MSADLLSIGELAKLTGLAVSAIRYYDEIGLITAESRVGGARQFTPVMAGRVSLAQRGKAAGFSLNEIREILDDTNGNWRQMIDSKLLELSAERDRLDRVMSELEQISSCGCEGVADCRKHDTCC